MFVLAACVMYGAAGLLAVFIERVFHLTPDQTHLARIVLLVVTLNVAASTAFSVFGGVINGFQRYDLNNLVGTASSVVTAAVNVLVLLAGYGLVELVVAMTAVRVLTLWVYRANAYRVFPGLRISASLFRRERLREVTGFSIHMAVIDWANKLNYSVDALVIGAFMNTTAVAVWAIAQRLAELSQRLANQLNDILFPAVVENDTAARVDRLRRIFIEGTKLSLATVVPMSVAMMLLAGPLVTAWVGADFAGSILILQLLSVVVMIRVGNATGMTVFKGAGSHRVVAAANIGTALCNVALSVALVKPFGLAGVALGTLVPVGVASILLLFPLGLPSGRTAGLDRSGTWRLASRVAGRGDGRVHPGDAGAGAGEPVRHRPRVRGSRSRLRRDVPAVQHQRGGTRLLSGEARTDAPHQSTSAGRGAVVRAVILAAGQGGRLRGVIGERPKCLARIGDRTLLDRQLDALQKAGITRTTVVTGYAADQVRQACPRRVDFVQNARYAVTNSLYSLWLAREQLRDGFIVLNCDVLFHPQLLHDLLTARVDDALLVSARRDGTAYGDEEMKVCIRRGLVQDIAKTLPEDVSDAENIGIARFGPDGAAALIEQMTQLVSSGQVQRVAAAGVCRRRSPAAPARR